MATNTSNKISAELCRAVDWKLFEITSCLISDEVTEEDFALSKVWFQERHAQDVVEERFACGLCAYPLCTQPLKTYVKASQIRDRAVPASPGTASTSSAKPSASPERVLVTSDKTKYRIDYNTKQIYSIERSKYYCSEQCLTSGETWIARLDGISPYARHNLTRNLLQKDANFVAKGLQHEKIPIEEVLALLGPKTTATDIKNGDNSVNNTIDEQIAPETKNSYDRTNNDSNSGSNNSLATMNESVANNSNSSTTNNSIRNNNNNNNNDSNASNSTKNNTNSSTSKADANHSNNNNNNNNNQTLPPPPPYTHSSITAEGALCVDMVAGRPQLRPSAETTNTTTNNSTPSSNTTNATTATATAKNSSDGIMDASENIVALTGQPVIGRKVRPSALRGNAAFMNSGSTTSTTTTNDTASNTTNATNANDNNNKGSNIDLLFKEMHELQQKYQQLDVSVANLKLGAEPILPQSNTNNIAVTQNNSSNNSASYSTKILNGIKSNSSSDKAGTVVQAVGARGPKSLSWDLDTTTTTTTTTNTVTHSNISNVSSNNQLKSALQKKKITKPAPILGLKVVERTHATPLSAAALPTKREPPANNNNNSGSSSSNRSADVVSAEEARRLAMTIEGHHIVTK